MNKLLWLLLGVLLVTRAGAQSNATVRLALIAETPEASTASDLLTVELSKDSQVTLLERNEIEKAYREQGLSAGNEDFVKLGQVLGADGLLLVRATEAATGMPAAMAAFGRGSKPKFDLSVQLLAVKPGVLLASEQFSSVDDIAQWAEGITAHLSPQLPKLSVLVQDALPISIVNLRAAMKSPATEELERQLTAFTIQRLSHERQLFVLERRKMQLLASEKQLQGLNNTSFWNGSYLLEGTVDRNGYSKDTITINAQLTPPKGGAPVSIEITGARTNLNEVIDRLAEKVCASLKLAPAAAPWNAADEARKYFEEARWALKWGVIEQAQNASDSAWALGKQDMDCVQVRLDAYLRAIPEVDPSGIRHFDGHNKAIGISVTNQLEPEEINQALHVLQIYEQFGRTLSPDDPQQGSPYYNTGLNILHKATGVLSHFYFHRESHAEFSDKLADLRAATRAVAAWMGHSPSVRKTYWLGAHFLGRDELYNDFDVHVGTNERLMPLKNLYQTELQSGRFWQDKPEDCVALYRSLMESPIFVVIHNDLWNMREDGLVAWNAEDRKRIPAVWQGFVANLNSSTNAFLQMEGKIGEFVDAQMHRRYASDEVWQRRARDAEAQSIYVERDRKAEAAWTNLFDFIFSHYDQIVTGREQLVFLGLGVGGLIPHEGEVIPTLQKLDEEYRTIYDPKLNALQNDYHSRFGEQLKEMHNSEMFDAQKDYLAKFTPFDWTAFYKLFYDADYSKAQAAELRPLLTAYQSNLIAQANANTSPTNGNLKSLARSIVFSTSTSLGKRLDEILTPKPPATNAPAVAAPAVTPPPAVAVAPPSKPSVVVSNQTPLALPETPTNALVARRFLAIPTNQLPARNIASLAVFSHRMRDDKLLLNLQYMDWWVEPWVDERGHTNSPQLKKYREAGAVLEPDNGWTVTPFPRVADSMANATDFLQGAFGITEAMSPQLYVEIFRDAIYVSDPEVIRRYDVQRKHWSELPFPGQERAQLYVVNDHLYAASSEGIWEILDGGKSAHILASVRRLPAVSALDSRDTLGKPVLFSGKDHSLWAALNGEVFSWDGRDWKSVLTIENVATGPIITQGTALFRTYQSMQPTELWRLLPNETQPVLCLRDERPFPPGTYNRPAMQAPTSAPKPSWNLPAGMRVPFNGVAVDGSTIYLLSVPVAANRTWTSDTMGNRRRLEATLACLAPESREALTIPIGFDANAGPATVPAGPNRGSGLWIECSSESVLIGAAGWPGVWALPKSEIQAEIKRQIADRPPAKKEIVSQPGKAALAKYDLNHDGQFDLEEWEAAISDPAFLELEVDRIDLNKNDQLDLDELAYFDANRNGVLDEPELAGILAIQHILAAKVLKEYDANRNASLEREEFDEFVRNKQRSMPGMMAMQTLPSSTMVGRIEHYLQYATEEEVQQALLRMIPGWYPQLFASDKRRAENLKEEINLYWAKQQSSFNAQRP